MTDLDARRDVAAGARTAIVVGAGVVGASIAQRLARRGWRVTIIDQQRPGHVRAASGAASRILHCAAGDDAGTTASAWSARALWQEIERETGARIYLEAGCANIAGPGDDSYHAETVRVLAEQGVPHERLDADQARALFPSISLKDDEWVLFEPHAGALLARQAVQAMVADALAHGATLVAGRGRPDGDGVAVDGRHLVGDRVIYACGGWTQDVFPELLAGDTYQHDLFFFGASTKWATPPTPVWVDVASGFAGMGDVDGLGVRLGGRFADRRADLDAGRWDADVRQEDAARRMLGRRFPALADAPLIGAVACHSTDIRSVAISPVAVIAGARLMRHPDHGHVWIVGDGSGTLFMHGPNIALELERLLD